MDLTLAICVYNAEKYLAQTLQSVMDQTMQDFELLIVDDCSTDSSVAVIEEFFDKYPRQYELIRLEQNRGIGHARHFALNKSKTKYILYLDADDLFEPTLTSDLYNCISSDEDLMGVSCWSRYMNVKGELVHGGTFLGEKTKSDFIEKASNKKLIFLPIHTMFDREIAINAGGFVIDGFPEGKPRMQDYCEELDLWTRMSDQYVNGKAFITLPKVLYYYRKADGLSSNHFNMIIKMRYTKQNLLRRRAGEKELTFIEFYDSLSDKQIRGYRRDAKAADDLRNGVMYLKKGKYLKAVSLVLSSFVTKPGYLFDKLKNNAKLS